MTSRIEYLNPPDLAPALGLYSQASFVPAQLGTFHIAGQVSADVDGSVIGAGDFPAQVRQTYANVQKVVTALGETCDSIAVMRTYIVGPQHLPTFMAVRNDIFPAMFSGPDYPPNTLLMIDRLVKEELLIEVEAVVAKLHD